MKGFQIKKQLILLKMCVTSLLCGPQAYFMEIQMGCGGGGGLELGNAEGRGTQAVLEIQVDGGSQKTMPSVVGVWIFSGITHGMITCMYGFIIYIQCTMIAKPIKVQDLCYSVIRSYTLS